MVTSQNGWVANNRAVIASFDLPGGKAALHAGSAGQVLAWCARRWHAEVEPLLWPGCWGYAERPIRGGVQLSNHASGTALDLCAPRHPLGTNPAANFSAAQIAAVRAIMRDTGGLIRWGGDYTGRKDGMHIEVNDGVSPQQLDALWARLSGAPQPAAPAAATGDGGNLATLSYGMKGDPRVAAFQQQSNAYNWQPPLPVVPATGNYLDQTKELVRLIQAQVGITGPDADGSTVGPRTKGELAKRGFRW
jgi:hypothetical protein